LKSLWYQKLVSGITITMDTRKAKTFERQIIEVFARKKAKRLKQDDQHRLR
jgi:hypothetical protein